MFELAGHKVQTRSYLSPSVHNFDVIVWFPDDFKPPEEEPQKFLEEWLYRGQGKTLIYVGRDYDATIDYWEKVLPTAPPEQSVEVLRRLAQARAEHARAVPPRRRRRTAAGFASAATSLGVTSAAARKNRRRCGDLGPPTAAFGPPNSIWWSMRDWSR